MIDQPTQPRGPLRLDKGSGASEIPRGIASEKPPCTDHDPELCCVKCAPYWSKRIAALPPRQGNPLMIKSDEHAHTSSMRLHNVANLLEKDPSLMGALSDPDLHDRVLASLRAVADQIRGE